jgi:hypothetical protein
LRHSVVWNCQENFKRQARELAKVEPAKRVEVLKNAAEAGRKTFVEVGLALAEIRDARLYRSDFDTFEEYCRTKWGWAKSYAYNLITAAATVKLLPAKTSTIVDNEGKARELARVEPAKRVEVLKNAAEAGPVTASKSVSHGTHINCEPKKLSTPA